MGFQKKKGVAQTAAAHKVWSHARSSAGEASNAWDKYNERVTAPRDCGGVKVALKDWQFECFGRIHTHVGIKFPLNQHLVLNRLNNQDSSPLGTSRLTDRHTQMIHSSQPLHACSTAWVLTDTSQQQLYPKQNRENNNESDACRFVTIFDLSRAAIAAHSGCLRTLPSNLHSSIKIPMLLVNSLSSSCSASHPRSVSAAAPAMWCRCLVSPSKYVWSERRLCLMQAHWGGVRAKNRRLIKVQLTSATCPRQQEETENTCDDFLVWHVMIWMSFEPIPRFVICYLFCFFKL